MERVRPRRSLLGPVILIGLGTVDKLRQSNPLNPAERVKISRADIKRIIWRTLWRLPFPTLWEKLAAGPRS